MTRTEKENLVPVWERITISFAPSAARIGMVTKKRHIIAGGCQRALYQKCLVEVQYLRT